MPLFQLSLVILCPSPKHGKLGNIPHLFTFDATDEKWGEKKKKKNLARLIIIMQPNYALVMTFLYSLCKNWGGYILVSDHDIVVKACGIMAYLPLKPAIHFSFLYCREALLY